MATLVDGGTPLPWEDSLPHIESVRDQGLDQFISLYNKVKDFENNNLMWGEEVEYAVLKLSGEKDDEDRKVQLSLRAHDIREWLNGKEKEFLEAGGKETDSANWLPEYGSWMLEGTPRVPYSGFAHDLATVEASMRRRRARLLAALAPDEIAPSITSFPMMGVGDFTYPSAQPNGPLATSKWVPDECINPHARFGTLTQNIRKRRGSTVDIRVPLYVDKNTFKYMSRRRKMVRDIGHAKPSTISGLQDENRDRDLSENLSEDEKRDLLDTAFSATQLKEDYYDLFLAADDQIVMDAMAFGMGCCCLQVTFQAKNINESRRMYDLLTPLAPIMMGLTAAAPIFKGQLADTDVRWNVIAGAVDDRTPQERGEYVEPGSADEKTPKPQMAGGGSKRMPKSRYDSVSNYLYDNVNPDDPTRDIEQYNDLNPPISQKAYDKLMAAGIDPRLSQHIAHLWTRDPLVNYAEYIDLDPDQDVSHFETIQGTNWQSLRWKPPPLPGKGGPHVGWRTEFRSMELQLTDFENAAFATFVVLCSRVISFFDLNLYMPLSLVDENMAVAHRRDAVRSERFWFRKHLVEPEGGLAAHEDMYERMTAQQILMGKGSYFPGLIPMCISYLDYHQVDEATKATLVNYLRFIRMRSSGELLTNAAWMRQYVTNHPDYQEDSVVTQQIAFDLMKECHDIGIGATHIPELLGEFKIEPLSSQNPFPAALKNVADSQERAQLLKGIQGKRI